MVGSVSGVRGPKKMWRGATHPLRRWPRTAKALVGLAALGALLIAAANGYILLGAEGESTSVVADVPRAVVAIVPGALVQPDGKMSGMLADRVRHLEQPGVWAQRSAASRTEAARFSWDASAEHLLTVLTATTGRAGRRAR